MHVFCNFQFLRIEFLAGRFHSMINYYWMFCHTETNIKTLHVKNDILALNVLSDVFTDSYFTILEILYEIMMSLKATMNMLYDAQYRYRFLKDFLHYILNNN